MKRESQSRQELLPINILGDHEPWNEFQGAQAKFRISLCILWDRKHHTVISENTPTLAYAMLGNLSF